MKATEPSKSKSPLTELQRLRDEVRVRLHLAGLEAKAQWANLETKLNQVESDLTHRGDTSWNSAAELVLESARAFRSVLARETEAQAAKPRLVSEVMTAVVRTCRPEDTLAHAARIMWENDCGAVPVVDDEGRPSAMITDRDICMAAYFQRRPLAESTVSSAMSRAVHVCSTEDTLAVAEARLAALQIRRLPVVDPSGRVVGIVSLADIARLVPPTPRNADEPDVGRTLSAISVSRSGRPEGQARSESQHGNAADKPS